MKKVLIISYYWPPGTGAGVFRWLKFCKYLRSHGWEPAVYTPLNPEAQGRDTSLEKDIPKGMTVIKKPIREPYALYKLLTGRSQKERIQSGFLNEQRNPGKADRIAAWIRGNYFIPDARKFWIRPSVRFLSKWLSHNKMDAMVSTGPPHSMHMIAMGLKEKLGLPWLADFRDPWTGIDFYDKLMPGERADRKHRQMEQGVLSLADKVVAVSHGMASELEGICHRKVEVVSNGFDPDDFRDLPEPDPHEFCITHLGSMNADRNPLVVWETLSHLVSEDPFFSEYLQVRLIGKTDFSVQESIKQNGIMHLVDFIPCMPHQKALQKAASSAILLLPVNNTPNARSITTGKLFDYLALQRPVLCIGPPTGDAASIIKETRSGTTIDFYDRHACRNFLLKSAERFKKNQSKPLKQSFGQFDRKKLTSRMAGLLNDMCR